MYMNNMNTMTMMMMMMMMMFTIYSSQFTFTKTTSYEGNIVYKCVCVCVKIGGKMSICHFETNPYIDVLVWIWVLAPW